MRVSGFSEKPAPTPSQSLAGSRPRRSKSAAICSGGVRSSAITATPTRSPAPPRRTRPASRAPWRRGGRWTKRTRSRARRSGRPAAARRRGRGRRRRRSPRPLTLEQGDALDVRGLGKHVDRPHACQPIAGLDQLGGVRGERRRVAGDVDDPLSLALDHPADDLLGEPGAGGVDDEDVGSAGRLEQRPHAGAGAAGDEPRVLDPVAARVALGVGDRLGDDLEPPHLACVRREGQTDRADPAVEVEEPLPVAERGELARDGVEALGHLGVGLEEGAVRDLQLQSAEALAQAFLAEHSGRPLGSARVALDHRVQVDRRLGEAGRRGDQPRLDLAGAPPLADDEVAEDAAREPADRRRVSPRALPSRGPRCGHGCRPPRRAGSPRPRRSGPSGPGMKSERRLSLELAEGVLELVAVPPLLQSRDDLLHREPIEAADPPQGVVNLILLVGELALVGRACHGAPGQGSPSWTQRSASRSAAGSSSSTARASAKRRFLFVTSARTRSPGRAPATKTTSPSARATPRPPCASESISSSRLSELS